LRACPPNSRSVGQDHKAPPSSAKRNGASASIAPTSAAWRSPSPAASAFIAETLRARSVDSTSAEPSGRSTAVGVGVWQNSSPWRARSSASAAWAGEVRNSTKVAAITSWEKPGSVAASVRMQPPMRSSRSSSSTRSPFRASIAPATSALMPDPMMT
jgi:hypothetical protein